jgi:hypothetical protein
MPRERLFLLAMAGEHRAHRRERGEHLRVGAPGREPPGQEPRAIARDGGDAGFPVGERRLALGGDPMRGEEHHGDRAGDEDADVDPGDALARGGAAPEPAGQSSALAAGPGVGTRRAPFANGVVSAVRAS